MNTKFFLPVSAMISLATVSNAEESQFDARNENNVNVGVEMPEQGSGHFAENVINFAKLNSSSEAEDFVERLARLDAENNVNFAPYFF